MRLLKAYSYFCISLAVTLYVIYYAFRFFRQLFLLFAVHLASLSIFRFLASVFQTMNAAMTAGSFGLLFMFLFGGFVITKRKEIIYFLHFLFEEKKLEK